jgi:hypothetical protein
VIVIFSTSRRLVSRIIRRVTGEPVSHVGLLTFVEGVPVVLHADVGGVQFTTLRAFGVSNEVVVAYQNRECASVPCTLRDAVLDLGTGYDYVSLFARAFVMALRWCGLSVRNPMRSPRSVVCSEFVARVVPAFVAFDAEEVTPGELLSFCRDDPKWETRVVA